MRPEAKSGENESTVTPARYAIAEHEDGTKTIEVIEGELEQRYGLGDEYGCMLFAAVCRMHGVQAYRRPRLHRSTVCARTTLSKHEALWRQFLEWSRQLDRRLSDATEEFVREVEREGLSR